MSDVVLATEDELSGAVGVRVLASSSRPLAPALRLRRSGAGYLRSRIDSWCQMAQRQPVLLIADLDRTACAPALIADWMGSRARPSGLIFRVAVREVEAWLLADHPAMQKLLGKSVRLPDDPDSLPDPKAHLLGLARRAGGEVRGDLVGEFGGALRQGLGYNARLCQLVVESWDPARAATRSRSLSRARRRLDELAGT
ncbi:MAG: hypothetical protein RLZZ450_699 [Pseudomonadota bacterium]|jgi:hypothetical protein